MVCTSLGSLLRPLFYFLCYIHFSLSVQCLGGIVKCQNKIDWDTCGPQVTLLQWVLTGGADGVADDGGELEEEEEDAEEADDDGLHCDALQLGVLVADLSEVGALGAPHGRRAHPEDDGARDERVELGVELSPDVGRVAEHGQHLRERFIVS